jgi:hypothetical protein
VRVLCQDCRRRRRRRRLCLLRRPLHRRLGCPSSATKAVAVSAAFRTHSRSHQLTNRPFIPEQLAKRTCLLPTKQQSSRPFPDDSSRNWSFYYRSNCDDRTFLPLFSPRTRYYVPNSLPVVINIIMAGSQFQNERHRMMVLWPLWPLDSSIPLEEERKNRAIFSVIFAIIKMKKNERRRPSSSSNICTRWPWIVTKPGPEDSKVYAMLSRR